MKVWITKYALSKGVYVQEVTTEFCGDGMVAGPGTFESYHGEGREWHRTKEGAIARAESMRIAKIKSLQKSIARIEKLKFD